VHGDKLASILWERIASATGKRRIQYEQTLLEQSPHPAGGDQAWFPG